MVTDMQVMEDSIQLTLDTDVGDPMDGLMQGFAIAGEDRKFHPAAAAYAEKGKDNRGRVQLDRKKILLSSSMVPKPIHFRYAWGRNPLANAQATGNKDLPLATQRSDDWVMERVPLGVFEEDSELPISRGDRNKIIQALKEMDLERKLHEAQQAIDAASR